MINFELLRCIWQNEPSHPVDTDLQLVDVGDPDCELLVCKGCGASFLVKNDIPIMLSEDDLVSVERHRLRQLRRMRPQ